MKLPKMFAKKVEKKVVIDFYQRSIERVGRDQLKKMVEKGLNIPVVVL